MGQSWTGVFICNAKQSMGSKILVHDLWHHSIWTESCGSKNSFQAPLEFFSLGLVARICFETRGYDHSRVSWKRRLRNVFHKVRTINVERKRCKYVDIIFCPCVLRFGASLSKLCSIFQSLRSFAFGRIIICWIFFNDLCGESWKDEAPSTSSASSKVLSHESPRFKFWFRFERRKIERRSAFHKRFGKRSFASCHCFGNGDFRFRYHGDPCGYRFESFERFGFDARKRYSRSHPVSQKPDLPSHRQSRFLTSPDSFSEQILLWCRKDDPPGLLGMSSLPIRRTIRFASRIGSTIFKILNLMFRPTLWRSIRRSIFPNRIP